MPAKLFNFLLHKGFFLKPGLETSTPSRAVDLYIKQLKAANREIKNTNILQIGFGGVAAVAVELLELQANHIWLYDPYCIWHNKKNSQLAQRYPKYFSQHKPQITVNPQYITILENLDKASFGYFDYVFSQSVLEHVRDVNSLIFQLAKKTTKNGMHIHFVDLRDHFSRYPFQMLCYSSKIWENFLDPPTHLNRLRLKNYREIFQSYFEQVKVFILEMNIFAFEKLKKFVRDEFVTGNIEEDASTKIVVVASKPLV